MYIIRGLRNLPPRFRGGVVTIGNFDGIHRGHQELFRQVRLKADALDAPALAITFEPHPARLLRPSQAPARIIGVRGKARWMGRHGLDAMFILHFNRALAALSPEAFVREILVEGLAVKTVLVGRNFRFGRGGGGDGALLQHLGEQFGFEAVEADLSTEEGETISSTRVRMAVHQKNFDAAARLLGRPFEIEARVGGGRRIGRGLGYPTANLALTDLLHPPAGVYVVEGRVDGQWLAGVANVGINPTFGGTDLHLEVHMLAPCGDLYRRVLRVRFWHHLRDEIKFPDPEALKAQIALDVARAEAFLAQQGRN